MTETEQPHTNGLDSVVEEDENNKTRPADIEQDMREMERRKRVEAIMCSRLFREELERIVDGQMKQDGPSAIMQQISDMMGVPVTKMGSIFKGAGCVVPINDIRGVEAMGYEKGEKILRCKLAATFRLLESYGYTSGIQSVVTARLNADQELFLVNPYGLMLHEVTASSLNKVDMQGYITEQGTTNFGINTSQFILHSVIHAARPDIRCIINVGHNAVVAVSSTKQGLLPLTKDAAVLGEIAIHNYSGALNEPEEREKLIRSLGPISKVLLLTNHGALCCGETIEEAFYEAQHIVKACEAQLNLLPAGLDNLVVIPEETRKAIYDASRKPPEVVASQEQQDNKERPAHQTPKWRVGGAEFEALMRMLDNAGFRTGYIYRNPLVKHEVPKPKNDVEVPPAVSSLGYLLEEEELYRQGIWKKGGFMKAGDRTRWLNSPNVYQKVEVLETGTPDPKKITKWVDTQAEEWVVDGSPTHSTPVKIDSALQFVPTNTNPREFKRIQQQIKDYRRADKISAGPQSHILEGVTWDEANRLKDANVSKTGDHVVLMGAASKGIIQRGYQHNATVYKAPYAKNPFDSVTDDELNEYKKTVEKKRTGEYTDTDFSESEALSSLPISGQVKSPIMSPPSQSEPEDAEHVVMRIETKQAPKPSQPEVVLSDANAAFLSNEKYEQVVTGKPPKKGKDSTNKSSSKKQANPGNREFNSPDICSLNDLRGVNVSARKQTNSKISIQAEPFYTPISTRNKCFSWLNHSLPSLSFASCKSTELNSFYQKFLTPPYRTTSHFGFNTPIYRDPQHFHMPSSPTKFVPLRRSKSFEDLFCTDKYLNLPGGEIPRKILSAIRKRGAEQPVEKKSATKSSRVLFKDDGMKDFPSVSDKATQAGVSQKNQAVQVSMIEEENDNFTSISCNSCPAFGHCEEYCLSDDIFQKTLSAPPTLGSQNNTNVQEIYLPQSLQSKCPRLTSEILEKWNLAIKTGRHDLLLSMLSSNSPESQSDKEIQTDDFPATPIYRTYAEFFDHGPEDGDQAIPLSNQISNQSMQTVIENPQFNVASSQDFLAKCTGSLNYPMLEDERLTLVSNVSNRSYSGPDSLTAQLEALPAEPRRPEKSMSSVSSSIHSGHDYKNCNKCSGCLQWQKWHDSEQYQVFKQKRKEEREKLMSAMEGDTPTSQKSARSIEMFEFYEKVTEADGDLNKSFNGVDLSIPGFAPMNSISEESSRQNTPRSSNGYQDTPTNKTPKCVRILEECFENGSLNDTLTSTSSSSDSSNKTIINKSLNESRRLLYSIKDVVMPPELMNPNLPDGEMSTKYGPIMQDLNKFVEENFLPKGFVMKEPTYEELFPEESANVPVEVTEEPEMDEEDKIQMLEEKMKRLSLEMSEKRRNLEQKQLNLEMDQEKLEALENEADKSSPDSIVSAAGTIYLTDKSSDSVEFTYPQDINILTGKKYGEESEEGDGYKHKETTVSSCSSMETETTNLSSSDNEGEKKKEAGSFDVWEGVDLACQLGVVGEILGDSGEKEVQHELEVSKDQSLKDSEEPEDAGISSPKAVSNDAETKGLQPENSKDSENFGIQENPQSKEIVLIDLVESGDEEFQDSLEYQNENESLFSVVSIEDDSLENQDVEFVESSLEVAGENRVESSLFDPAKLTPISPVRKSLVKQFDVKLQELRSERVGGSFLQKIQEFDYSKESPVVATDEKEECFENAEDGSDEYSKVWDKIPYLNFEHSNAIERTLNNQESNTSSSGNADIVEESPSLVRAATFVMDKEEDGRKDDEMGGEIEKQLSVEEIGTKQGRISASTPDSKDSSLEDENFHNISSISSSDSGKKNLQNQATAQRPEIENLQNIPAKSFEANNFKENEEVTGYTSDVSDSLYPYKLKGLRKSFSKRKFKKISPHKILKAQRNFVDENVRRIGTLSASKTNNPASIFAKTNPFTPILRRNEMVSSFQSEKRKLWVTFNSSGRKPLTQKLADNTMSKSAPSSLKKNLYVSNWKNDTQVPARNQMQRLEAGKLPKTPVKEKKPEGSDEKNPQPVKKTQNPSKINETSKKKQHVPEKMEIPGEKSGKTKGKQENAEKPKSPGKTKEKPENREKAKETPGKTKDNIENPTEKAEFPGKSEISPENSENQEVPKEVFQFSSTMQEKPVKSRKSLKKRMKKSPGIVKRKEPLKNPVKPKPSFRKTQESKYSGKMSSVKLNTREDVVVTPKCPRVNSTSPQKTPENPANFKTPAIKKPVKTPASAKRTDISIVPRRIFDGECSKKVQEGQTPKSSRTPSQSPAKKTPFKSPVNKASGVANKAPGSTEKTPLKSILRTPGTTAGKTASSTNQTPGSARIVKVIRKPAPVEVNSDILEAQRRFLQDEENLNSLDSVSSNRSDKLEEFREAFIESQKRMSEITRDVVELNQDLGVNLINYRTKESTESSTEFLELERKIYAEEKQLLPTPDDLKSPSKMFDFERNLLRMQDEQILEHQRQFIEEETAIRNDQLNNLDDISNNLSKCLSTKDKLVDKLDNKMKMLDNEMGECLQIHNEIEESRQKNREYLEEEKANDEEILGKYSLDLAESED